MSPSTRVTGVESARARFEARAAAARRRPRMLMAGGVAVVVLAALAVWLLWFSSLLTSESVELHATGELAAPERARLVAVAAVPTGIPLMRVDTDAVRERLLQDKALRDVAVDRSLPHTVRISGTPRIPTMALKNSQGQVEVVDDEGTVFRVQSAVPAGVPLVTASSSGVSQAGRLAALECLRALPSSLRSAVSDVKVSGADQVTFTLTVKDAAARTVVWGGTGDADLKAKVLAALLEEPGTTIDVSVPTSPVTR